MNKKKLLALVLAALMSVSTTVVAFADESTAATQNASVSALAAASEDPTLEVNDVKAAKLHDTRVETDSENAIADEDLYTDYTVT